MHRNTCHHNQTWHTHTSIIVLSSWCFCCKNTLKHKTNEHIWLQIMCDMVPNAKTTIDGTYIYMFLMFCMILDIFFVTMVHEGRTLNFRPASQRRTCRKKKHNDMSFHMERSSQARFCRFCLARAVRRRLSRAVRPLPKEGTTFDEAGGVDALSPELAALRDLTLGDAGARCRGHASRCTLRRRNRRARRGAHSCNGGWRQRFLSWWGQWDELGEIAINVGLASYLADVPAPPRRHGPGLQGELKSRRQRTARNERSASGGQHSETKPLTAPSNKSQSSGGTDPRAGSQARHRGARFGKGIGECNGVPIAATVAESSGAWACAPQEAIETPAEAITSWTPLDTVSVFSANQANWDKAALSECKWLARDDTSLCKRAANNGAEIA